MAWGGLKRCRFLDGGGGWCGQIKIQVESDERGRGRGDRDTWQRRICWEEIWRLLGLAATIELK